LSKEITDLRQRVIELQESEAKLREAENVLIESEEEYRHLIESLPHAVAIYQDQKLVFINSSGLKMIGWESMDQSLQVFAKLTFVIVTQ
jgi:PAS domain-containing protein